MQKTDSKAGKVATGNWSRCYGRSSGHGGIPFAAVLTGVAVRAAAGVAAAGRQKINKAAEVAASTAAGIGGGVAGVALGLLATPFVIVASPFVGTATGIATRIGNEEDVLDEYLKLSILMILKMKIWKRKSRNQNNNKRKYLEHVCMYQSIVSPRMLNLNSVMFYKLVHIITPKVKLSVINRSCLCKVHHVNLHVLVD